LKKHQDEAKRKYQVLCCNCNWIKRFENGEHLGGVVKINSTVGATVAKRMSSNIETREVL
jgi:hypothetical protein